MSNNTVEIDEEALLILISEAQATVESISDNHWHENEGQRVKDAIDAGYDALNNSDNE